jgi:hypothetical protein
LAHLAPPASHFLLHCAGPLLLGLSPPFVGPIGPRALGVFLGIRFLLVKVSTTEPANLLLPPPHAPNQNPQPASRRPHGRPRPPPLKRKRRRVASSFIPPLNNAPSALQYSSNRRLQAEALTPAVTLLHRPDAPIKGPPALTKHSHTISLSPPPLFRAHVIALLR